MRYSIVASTLLGAGAALAPIDTGLTCQLPLTDELLIGAERCQGGLLDAKTVLACHVDWDASRGGLMSLSQDAAACSLTVFEALEAQDFHTTPFCNQTQMDACAKAMGHLTSYHETDQAAMLTHQQAPAEIIAQPLKGDANHYQIRLSKPAFATELYAFARRQQPRSVPAREHVDTAPGKLSARDSLRPAPTNAAPREKQPASKTPRIRSTSDLFSATASLIPSAPGSRHFAGMACALAIVSLIFVVWM
ncbi:hypothetical protein ACHAQH_006295 [Verticillium albo-atrum]